MTARKEPTKNVSLQEHYVLCGSVYLQIIFELLNYTCLKNDTQESHVVEILKFSFALRCEYDGYSGSFLRPYKDAKEDYFSWIYLSKSKHQSTEGVTVNR